MAAITVHFKSALIVKATLGDLEEELELDEDLLEDIALEDLELTDEEGDEEE